MNRPVGVIILALLNLVGGFWGIIFNLIVFLFGGLLLTGGVVSGNAQITGGGTVLIVTTSISWFISVVSIALSYGLFSLKEWALGITYILQIVNILVNVVRFFQSSGLFEIVGALINIAIAVFILYYLNKPNIKTAFGKA